MTGKKILIVDDEIDILEILSYNFKKENYEVFTIDNGVDAIKLAKKEIPDLIVLDVMMPQMDGIEACRLLKEEASLANTIIIFLTARGEEYSEIAGFDVGADDYITKPIRPRALLTRVKSLLKRNSISNNNIYSNEVVFCNLKVDINKKKFFVDSKEVKLPKKEFKIIKLLISNPEKVFERKEIFDIVWGNDVIVGERTLDVHIRKLRKKIGGDYIRTIKGVGYALV